MPARNLAVPLPPESMMHCLVAQASLPVHCVLPAARLHSQEWPCPKVLLSSQLRLKRWLALLLATFVRQRRPTR